MDIVKTWDRREITLNIVGQYADGLDAPIIFHDKHSELVRVHMSSFSIITFLSAHTNFPATPEAQKTRVSAHF